jgi:hypothetical protein
MHIKLSLDKDHQVAIVEPYRIKSVMEATNRRPEPIITSPNKYSGRPFDCDV